MRNEPTDAAVAGLLGTAELWLVVPPVDRHPGAVTARCLHAGRA